MENCHYKVYVGIDIHRLTHRVAIMPAPPSPATEPNRKEVKFLDIRNSLYDFQLVDATLKEYVNSPGDACVAVDHTGGHYSEPLVYFLQSRGYKVCHLEPKAVKAARERLLDQESKSDTIDAAGAAYLLYLRDVHGLSFRISTATPKLGSQASVLRSLVIQRQQFNKLAAQFTNRLHQLLLAVFPEAEAKCFRQMVRIAAHYPTPQDILASSGLKDIKRMTERDRQAIMALAGETVGIPGELYRDLIRHLSRRREEALAMRSAVSDLLGKAVSGHKYGPVLLSFPHVGPVAAATVIGVVIDIDQWPSKKALKKALGVYSTLKQSGASSGRGRMGKEGSRHGRRALFLVVWGCIQASAPDNDFRDYYLRQVAHGKPRLKAVVSTMGKMAEIMYHCLKNGESYRYQGKYGSLRHPAQIAPADTTPGTLVNEEAESPRQLSPGDDAPQLGI